MASNVGISKAEKEALKEELSTLLT